jgi:hypothetical protein
MNTNLIIPNGLAPAQGVVERANDFLKNFEPYEIKAGARLLLYHDRKSKAYYVICHLRASCLAQRCDLEATIDDGEEDDIYKLNRDITEDEAAYKAMEEDAKNGRGFEDMVLEYDTSYRKQKSLKVYGGQHRIRAITRAFDAKVDQIHGVRVYFSLSREQKVEIATVNNTSIAVPNDLLDRMREQFLGNELRTWCQTVGLLKPNQDFADRRDPEVPTVRVARTLIVNFYLGYSADIDGFHQPTLCKSGGIDEAYMQIRGKVKWQDQGLIAMGREFAALNRTQRQRVAERDIDNYAEFARKALSMAVLASWAYAAGLFQNHPEYLKTHYSLPVSVTAPDDPLNAKALSKARMKGIDPDTYRGLGTRSSPAELGRMLEVFLVLATKATKKRITKDLANAAIQSYEVKKAHLSADKAIGKL